MISQGRTALRKVSRGLGLEQCRGEGALSARIAGSAPGHDDLPIHEVSGL